MNDQEPLREIRNRLLHGVQTELDAILEALTSEKLVLTRHSGELRQCPVCGYFFVPSRTNQSYCRPACKQAAYQLRLEGDEYAVDIKVEPLTAGPIGILEVIQRLPPKMRGGVRVFLNHAVITIRVWAEDDFEAPGAALTALELASVGVLPPGVALTAGKITLQAAGKRRKETRYFAGQRVTHLTFGPGTVVKATLTKSDEELIVRFDKVGIKILSASVAPIAGHSEMQTVGKSPTPEEMADILPVIPPAEPYPT